MRCTSSDLIIGGPRSMPVPILGAPCAAHFARHDNADIKISLHRRAHQHLHLCLYEAEDVASRLRRARISFPVLKKGIAFLGTETIVPVRGLRPVLAARILTPKVPNPRSSTRSPRAMALVISPRIAFRTCSTSRW